MKFNKTLFLGLLCLAQAGWSDFFVQGRNSVSFIKTSSTIENLDTANYLGGGYSSSWTEDRDLTIDYLGAKLIYVNKPTNIYASVSGKYGWLIDGNTLSYPIKWNSRGDDIWGWGFETGYVMDVCESFKFIPHAGYAYNDINTEVRHQKEARLNPSCIANQNGKRYGSKLNNFYAGIQLDFTPKLFGCYDIQISTVYELGYTYGHGRDHVSNFFVTDVPATSFYGSRTKYRNLINHEFELFGSYQLNDKWQMNLGLTYNYIYNTHHLSTKLQRNQEIVDAGQFTATQKHKVTDYSGHSTGIVLSFIYNLSGEGGTSIVK